MTRQPALALIEVHEQLENASGQTVRIAQQCHRTAYASRNAGMYNVMFPFHSISMPVPSEIPPPRCMHETMASLARSRSPMPQLVEPNDRHCLKCMQFSRSLALFLSKLQGKAMSNSVTTNKNL